MNTKTSKTLRSRLVLAAAVALLAFAFAACSSSSKSSSSGSSAPDITIKNITFTPNPVSVKSGATVTVKNDDDVTHTVTSDDGASFNITLNAGSTKTFTAPTKAGSYKFHCNIHSTMHDTLTVT